MRSCCALYVDAGYLLASAATRVTGTSLRSGVRVDHDELIPRLISQAELDSHLPLLRLNWYDSGSGTGGQPDGVQARLGLMPRVKLRLGRLSYAGEQKGVDLRLGLDLVTHARNRTIDIAYLLSGDDDLTEAVEEAQGHGVQVILLAVPDDDGKPYGVARHLHRESDGLLLIDEGTVRESVHAAPRPAPPAAHDDHGSAVAAMAAAAQPTPDGSDPTSAPQPTGVPKPGPRPLPRPPGQASVPTAPVRPAGVPAPVAPREEASVVYSTTTGTRSAPPEWLDAAPDEAAIDEVCGRVIGTWLASVEDSDRLRLFVNRPSIPPDIDRALLQDLSARLHVYDIPEADRHLLRARFWARADELVPRNGH